MISYWGVEHGDSISKADTKYGKSGPPSPERRTQGAIWNYLAPGSHGLAAGKRGKKIRAATNEGGGVVIGGVAGGLVGSKLSLGRARVPLAAATGIAGGQLGLNRNQRKGYLKPERKR